MGRFRIEVTVEVPDAEDVFEDHEQIMEAYNDTTNWLSMTVVDIAKDEATAYLDAGDEDDAEEEEVVVIDGLSLTRMLDLPPATRKAEE